MKNALCTRFGECAGDEEVVKAVLEWIIASDLCAQASDEDFPRYWRNCSEKQDNLHQYFTDEAVTSIIINKNDIRQIISDSLNDTGII